MVHGYAQNGHSWEKQEAALLAAGHRVITYDRRGCGASSRPSIGYDFDTLAGDLDVLLSRLDLRGVVLAGFAMGTGEVARYLAAHGPGQVKAAVLVAPLLPFLLKNSFYVAISVSAHAALRCITACLEDFRADLAKISIPVLVIHGDQDRVLPYEATGSRLPPLLRNPRSIVIAGGPHAIIWTHADEVNQVLLDFIGNPPSGSQNGQAG
jgi:non-heme chloroperoxidase